MTNTFKVLLPGLFVIATTGCDKDPAPSATTLSGSPLMAVDNRAAADNTKVNERDRAGETALPTDQSNDKSDLEITATIRKELVGDESLSFTAKNVKVITNGSKVVLRGPVTTDSERTKIEMTAKKTVGVTSVANQLEVKP